MNLIRTRKLSVQLRQYEPYVFEASVSHSHHDLGVTSEELAELSDEERDKLWERLVALVMQRLTDQLKQEVKDCQMLADDDKSYLMQFADLDQKEPPRRRASNRRRIRRQ